MDRNTTGVRVSCATTRDRFLSKAFTVNRMTISELWDATWDYHARFNLMFIAGYPKSMIHRSKSFFREWDQVDYRIQQTLERAESAGKYKVLLTLKTNRRMMELRQ